MIKLVQKYQSTLKKAVTFKGIGVHSGCLSVVKVCPADVGCGIVFKRFAVDGTEQIFQAHASQTGATELSTALGHGRFRVETIEHLMAAIAAYNLDNLIIEVSSHEIPILDGSSWQYCQAFDEVGVIRQNVLRSYFVIKKPLRVESTNGVAEFLPFDGRRFDITISFPSSAIGKQHLTFDLTPQSFRDDLSRARTFGFVKDVEKLWVSGKGIGASLENSLIIGLNDKIINPDGPYWKNEYVRHKMLDAIGDTALLGAPFIGLFRSYCSGHRMNSQLVKAVLADESCYEKSHL
ncbi:UDP-3-O-acyl-N-acetylglucosamine deacetylase [Bartonella henselae]|uniref:UDP-3-O-acyl-N-acetylglucosamine deacetylase n=1 Tax=Bartonella henselae TaxID=38323 RepID=UPI0003DFA4C7|nr:UDP-3-O-acyl-N-acetylglucosamine deacetylase [Bartonella henselae]ETS11324.1 UDP-3-O-[3-hydroxymyristoyl] N-acetylglucosamine deacetylase [Bartonella henselae JK 42]ETS15329.1 UDP-3-O-[3-hydroxymyristoyl] N-acetylglucosamine deacetylase [Bartonella henselae JK 41]KEC57212.1 UDP-3-O-[3-hydroxymyristoyl] N-acetylglucosamine deacetylase [Bartonella henselae str. Zeus]KEC59800.1 UDP-3-O-[3-hydroxymyristoyl] N-acetylglucosamine deacetylase [Bartonella henselae JK 53]MDM9983004.1 UDP-3-O-acyl-N-a